MNLLAPDVETLVSQLMPWLEPPRSRSLSRSDAVRRPRSPSLSPFWSTHLPLYQLLQRNFPRFTTDMKTRPEVFVPLDAMPTGPYALNQFGLKRWDGKHWVFLHKFDALDLMVSFPLRAEILYFTVKFQQPESDSE